MDNSQNPNVNNEMNTASNSGVSPVENTSVPQGAEEQVSFNIGGVEVSTPTAAVQNPAPVQAPHRLHSSGCEIPTPRPAPSLRSRNTGTRARHHPSGRPDQTETALRSFFPTHARPGNELYRKTHISPPAYHKPRH